MENNDDYPNRSIQIYPPKKRKLVNIAQHNDIVVNVVGETSIVASANGSYTGCDNNCTNDEARDHSQTVVAQEALCSHENVDQVDDIKSVVGRLSPLFSESLWDGTILLNGSMKVDVAAFFESGEKLQDIPWPKIIVIKGKVKLDEFEYFVKQLPHSRNRAIMVISLCWKVGSSKVGLKEMKEFSSSFEVTEKVGLAEIHEGCNLYLCPRSEAVITILYEYGFLKRMLTVDTTQESLMGFVVWKRKAVIKDSDDSEFETAKGSLCACTVAANSSTLVPCSNSHQTTPYSNDPGMAFVRNKSMVHNNIEKIEEIQDICMDTEDVTDEMIGEKVYRPEARKSNSPSRQASTPSLQSSQIASFGVPSVIACEQSQVLQMSPHEVHSVILTSPEIRQHVQPIQDSNCEPLEVMCPDSHFHLPENFTSAFKPYKNGLHGSPVQSQDVLQGTTQSDLATQKNQTAGPFCGSITQQKYASGTSGSLEMPQARPLLLHAGSDCTHTPNDKDSLSELDFPSVCGTEVKPNVQPLSKEIAGSSRGWIHCNLPVNQSGRQSQQPSHSLFQVESTRPDESVMAQGTFTNLCSKKISNTISQCNIERVCFGNNNGIGNGDMTECHNPKLDHVELYKTRDDAQPWSVPPITSRPQSTPETEDLFIDRHPHLSSGCLNPPRDEILLPHHHPDVEAENGLLPLHPPVLPDEGLFSRHPSRVLADEGLFPRHSSPVLANEGLFPRHRPQVLADEGSFPRHPSPVLANEGLFPRHPSPVLENESLSLRHRPQVLADEGLFPRHPSPILGNEGLFPRHRPQVLADEGLFPRHPSPVLADEGLFSRHGPPVQADQGLFHGHPRGLFLQYPPPAPADQGLFPRRPPPVPPYQGFFPQHPSHVLGDDNFFPRRPSHVLGDQCFIGHPPIRPPGYFSSSEDQGNNHGNFLDRQLCMFGQRLDTTFASATSGNIRPPSGFAPRYPSRPMSHSRPGNNNYAFERSNGLSGLRVTPGQYSRFGNGSDIRLPSLGQQ